MEQQRGMKPLDEVRLRLLLGQRWGCLGTLDEGAPSVSWVAYGVDGEGRLLLHLSRLARHTRHLLVDGRASLAVSEVDDRSSDPQTLARITLQGVVEPLAHDSDTYQRGRDAYLARLPDAAMRFGFEDFSLFSFTPQTALYIEGFGSTHRLTAARLQPLLVST